MSNAISVLVVDDEAIIRMHIADILENEGFTVIEATSANEAIKVLECRPDIKVVFTDIEMPGTMDGLALSHYVRRRWPPTIIIIASGRRQPQKNDMPDGAHFISKPFFPGDMAAVFSDIRRQAS